LSDELEDVVARWSARDPLDADAIAARADLAARTGDRERALRIVGGLLASNLPAADAASVAGAIAAAHERAGSPDACAFRVAAAELSPADVDALARASACEREAGRVAAAERWIAGPKRDEIAARAAKIAPRANDALTGDLVADVSWDASVGADLDVA